MTLHHPIILHGLALVFLEPQLPHPAELFVKLSVIDPGSNNIGLRLQVLQFSEHLRLGLFIESVHALPYRHQQTG